MRCLDCGNENELEAANCVSCGVSLHPSRARFYLECADREIAQGQYDAASLNISQADHEMLASSKQQRDKYLLNAYAFYLQGQMFYQQSKIEQAREEAVQAEQVLADEPGDKTLLIRVHRLMGNTYYYEGRMAEAAVYFRQLAALGTELGNYEVAAIAAVNLGNISVLSGDIAGSIEQYNRALAAAQQDGQPSSFARVYRVLAWLHSSYGPFPLGLEYADKAVAMRDQIANLDTRSLVLDEAAGVYLKAGMFERAEPYLHELYDISQRTGSKLIEERIMPHLVELLRHQDNSTTWFGRAVRLVGDTSFSALSKSDLALQVALYYVKRQDLTLVRRFLQQLTDHAYVSPMTEGVAAFHQALAVLQSALKQWDEATANFKQAFSQQIPLYDQAMLWKDYATMLLNKSVARQEDDARREGIAALEQAVGLFEELQLDYELKPLTQMRDYLISRDAL